MSNASEYTLSEQDVRAVINATKTNRDKLILELLAYTGCRREELVLLRIQDILLDYDMIMMPTVKQDKKKPNEKEYTKEDRITIAYQHLRRVPIINSDLKRDLIGHIQELKRNKRVIPESRLIQSRQSPTITEVMINNIVAEAGKNAGIKIPNPNRKHIHPHMFRHTFVRYARNYGMDYKAIQEIVGHTQLATTMDMYGKPTWEDKVKEAKKMENYGQSS